MSGLGSKTVVTPLKWDVCITPESRHRSATLPIVISSSATVERSPPTSTSPPRSIALTTRLSDGWSGVSDPSDEMNSLHSLRTDKLLQSKHLLKTRMNTKLRSVLVECTLLVFVSPNIFCATTSASERVIPNKRKIV